VIGSRTPERALVASALLVLGTLTVVSAGKRAAEGEQAFALFLLVTAPIAIVVICHRARAKIARQRIYALACALLALFLLTMTVGGVTGSAFAADLALAAAVALWGLLVRAPALIACAGTIAVSMGLLLAVGAPQAAAPAVTGTALAVTGLLLRPARPGPRPAAAGYGTVELERADQRAAARLCAAVFHHDPAMEAVVSTGRRRPAVLTAWFAGLFRVARRFGKRPVLAMFADEQLVAVRVAYEPGRYPPPGWSALLIAGVPLRGGLRVGWRAIRWMIAREHHHPREPHIYLETLATAHAHQGRGVGSSLLHDLCAEADRRRLPIILHTNAVANLAFYGRFGFVVFREARLPTGAQEWTLRRSSPPIAAPPSRT
jgi:GNAT superfamily N-acetyltransferase